MFGLIIFITQFPSLITHHSKYLTRLAPSLTCHYSIFFTLFVGLIPVTQCSFFFSITKPSEKKEKKEEETQVRRKKKKPPSVKGKRKKKKMKKCNPVKKERKKKDGQKLRLKADNGSLHVVLFTEMSLSYEL